MNPTVKAARLAKKPPFIAVLCGGERDGWINPELAFWMAMPGRSVYLCKVKNKRHQPYARNFAVEEFLKQDANWLCMIDNDVTPQHNLLELLDDTGGYDIIAPVTYMWAAGKESFAIQAGMKGDKEGEWVCPPPKVVGHNPYDVLGSSCIFIHRRVFENMKPPYFRYLTDPLTQRWGPTEDFDFTWRATEAGFRCTLDTRYACGHLHTFNIMSLHEWANWMTQSAVEYAEKQCQTTVKT